MAKSVSGSIDLKYRPNSYFWADRSGIQLSSNIKGAQRKAAYERALRDGDTQALTGVLAAHALPTEVRSALGSLHPWMMGGEYLPDRQDHEVEIARIVIASTTMDVTCVYAKQVGTRIRYRVVDEYEGMTLDGDGTKVTTKPMTLGDFTDFFMDTWNLLECLNANFGEYECEVDRVQGFVIEASSSFYAQFGALIRKKVGEWAESNNLRHASDEDEDEDEDEEQEGEEE